jgi:hypothetical protein
MDEFDRLIAEAQSQKFSGWDFSWLRDRLVQETPPWDYEQEVVKEFPRIRSLLDLGTGGGEFLSSLGQLPERTYATEGYPPNAVIARDRLKPLRVDVVRTYSEDNTKRPQVGALPFRTKSIDMINYPELNEFLGAPKTEPVWDLQVARQQITEAGLHVTTGQEAQLESRFKDIGAVVFLLLAIPWQLEGFTVDHYVDKLKELHKLIVRTGSFSVTARRFYLSSLKQ